MRYISRTYLSVIVTALILSSCNQAVEVDHTDSETDDQLTELLPQFDHNQPDTGNNKQRFRDFLKVEITPDVKNIYCFDDAIGIDADYMFSFNCSQTTSNKIIETNDLKIDTLNSDNAFGLQNDFDWWNKDRIAQLQKYSWTDGDQYFKYYWYDVDSSKAYFFDFDL